LSVWRSWQLPFFTIANDCAETDYEVFTDAERGVFAKIDQRSSSLHIERRINDPLKKSIKRNRGLHWGLHRGLHSLPQLPALFFAGSWRRFFLSFRVSTFRKSVVEHSTIQEMMEMHASRLLALKRTVFVQDDGLKIGSSASTSQREASAIFEMDRR
jgi:hypothetical protein